MDKKYRISVVTPSGNKLSFQISDYEILDGNMIRFFDQKYAVYKIFDSRLCEIEEVTK